MEKINPEIEFGSIVFNLPFVVLSFILGKLYSAYQYVIRYSFTTVSDLNPALNPFLLVETELIPFHSIDQFLTRTSHIIYMYPTHQ